MAVPRGTESNTSSAKTQVRTRQYCNHAGSPLLLIRPAESLDRERSKKGTYLLGQCGSLQSICGRTVFP